MKKIFKNKKAIGAEVDWIIAGGIFLIYLLMTLVYFKPGLNPVHNPQNLLDIVESEFERNAYWTITTQPMFVETIMFPNPNDPHGGNTNLADITTNGGGNSLCVEFKGEDGAATDSDKFPLQLEADKTKIFFVGATRVEETQLMGGKIDNQNRKNDKNNCDIITKELAETEKQIGVVASRDDFCAANAEAVGCGPLDMASVQPAHCGDEDVYNPDMCKTTHIPLAESCSPDQNNNNCADEFLQRDNCNTCRELETKREGLLAEIENYCQDAKTEETNVEVNLPTEIQLKEGYLNFNIDATTNNLKFIPYFTDKKTKYLLTYSNSIINSENTDPGGCNEADIDSACIIKDINSAYGSCHAKYELGVAETVKGISLAKFRTLADTCTEDTVNGYKCRKNTWGYPELKEFKIRVYTKEKTIAEFPKEPVIPTNINVYSRQFNTFILNEDGLREAVTVNILVW